MRKAFYLILFIVCAYSRLAAQGSDLKVAFDRAYVQYPAIPHGLLEAMAFSASKFQNLQPEPGMAHHHGPERFGIFASVEDGQGIFRNTLIDICQNAGVSPAQYKADTNVQVMAFAKYLSDACVIYQVNGNIKKAEAAIEAVSEIPLNNPVNEYANQLIAYEVYSNLKKGISVGTITVSPVRQLKAGHWFSADNFSILSAKTVTIQGSHISGGRKSFRSSGTGSTPAPAAVQTTPDYPSALWVTSPNYNSRGTTAITAITIHTTEGSYAGSIAWFQDTASQVSAHYILRSSDGQVTQMVLEANRAWHVGSENSYTIGIEHEGYVAQTGWYTSIMYQSSAALVQNICGRRSIDPKTCYSGYSTTYDTVLAASVKIKGHQHYPNQTHIDPGVYWDWVTYYNLINPCGAATGLAVSGVNTSGATLTWTAAAWMASYTVEVRATGSSTWTDYTVTTNTLPLSALSAGTTYQWQVKVNCTATDPSAYTVGGNFTTTSANGCLAPSAVTASNVSTSTATLSWTAVTGAVSYQVSWKATAASTWNTATVTGINYGLSGLVASTAYQYRVLTNCSNGPSGYSPTGTLTTQVTCYDPNETNNSSGTATLLTSGVPKYGKLCGSGTDVDWFKIPITTTSLVTFTLSQLPANYNVELYVNGSYVRGSYSADTISEMIVLNSQAAGTLYYRVYAASATDYNASRDYRVEAIAKAIYVPNGGTQNPIPLQGHMVTFIAYPNPAQNMLHLNITLDESAVVEYSLWNYEGQLLRSNKINMEGGEHSTEIDLSGIPSGLYTLRLSAGDASETKRISIVK